ncbi:MAG: RluA family pseudouridine synthase, partial [Clostridia bacterium]|nr:RluA family pseudouridine synthase [Clostridia bacterium]
FASRGCPSLGDFLYGAEGDTLIGRQALHCAVTAFRHPVSRRFMTITAALPDDMGCLERYFTERMV